MKIWALVFLTVYLLERVLDHGLDILNLRFMKRQKGVPAEFDGVIDGETLEKSRSYTMDKTVLGTAEGIFGEILLVVFLYCGLLDWYNTWLFGFHLNFILNGLLFFVLLATAQTLLNVPFDLYSTFRIENRYGFNRMKPGLWVADFLKSLVLQTLLLGVLGTAAFWFVRLSPDWWWLFIWAFFALFTLFMMVLSPYVIEPLFNKYTPLEGELAEKIRKTLFRTGISVDRVFTMDASKRSGHSNAYFTGIGRVKRIVLFDTLITQFTHDEILSVLAHEAGHWKKKHVMKRMAGMMAVSLAGIFAAWVVIRTDALSTVFGIRFPTFFTNVLLAGFVISIISFVVSPLSAWLSRKDEAEADRYAVDLIGSGEPMIGALKKLVRENLSNLHPHPLAVWARYSHPPVPERIERIRKMARPNP